MSRKNDNLNCYRENGICLYEYPMINGLKQYIQVRGADRTAPLMLFIHGGPGGSMAGICHVMQTEWEKHFTVVNWDQRNTCKTLFANKDKVAEIAETGSISDYISDIDAVIKYLHTVYEFEKIIIAGFSWGSILGAEYAKLRPENVSCYIGIGQLINHFEGLKYSCNWIKGLAKDVPADTAKTDGLIKRIENGFEFNGDTMKALRVFSMLGAKYIAKDCKPFPIKALLCSPFLSFREKLSMLNSDYRNFKGTYKTLTTHDFRHDLHFDVPVLFVSGDEDFVCPNQLLMQCFDRIEAPVKKNVVIPKASHTCFFDQPDVFVRTITEFISSLK